MAFESNQIDRASLVAAIEDIDVIIPAHAGRKLGMNYNQYYYLRRKYKVDFKKIKRRVKPKNRRIFSERILHLLMQDPSRDKEDVAKQLHMSNRTLSERISYYEISFAQLKKIAKYRHFALQVRAELEIDHHLSREGVARKLDVQLYEVKKRLSSGDKSFKNLKREVIFEKVRNLAQEGRFGTQYKMANALGMHELTLGKFLKELGISQKDLELARQNYRENNEDFEVVSHDLVSTDEKELVSKLMQERPNRSPYLYAMILGMACERLEIIQSEIAEAQVA